MFCDICEMFLEKREPQQDFPILNVDGSVSRTVKVHTSCAEWRVRYDDQTDNNIELDARRDGKWSKSSGIVPSCSVAWQNALCSCCREPLEEGQHVSDRFIFEHGGHGDLDYIELVHAECVPKEEAE